MINNISVMINPLEKKTQSFYNDCKRGRPIPSTLPVNGGQPSTLMPTVEHAADQPPCDELIDLRARLRMLEDWRITTQTDIKEIRDVVSQVKLLMSLSIGGGGLSILSLIILVVELIVRGKP